MMWINHQITQDFHRQYSITEKLLDVRSEHVLEIFKSKEFGQIAMFDEREILIERFLSVRSELLAHVGACCLRLEEPSLCALLLGGFNLEIAHELFKHEMIVDYVQSDEKVLDSLISFFPHFQAVREHAGFTHYAKAIDLPLRKYNLIVHQGSPNAHELDGISRMLAPGGVLIFTLPSPYLQEAACLESLQHASAHFSILMPFFTPFFGDECYAFASHGTHPLADLWLQRADLLDDLEFYSADIHEAAFALPTKLATRLRAWVKS